MSDDNDPESLDEYFLPSLHIGTISQLVEYAKPRKKKRRRPIGFLRDDWPDIIE